MQKSENLNELAAALAKAQAKIKTAAKDSENPHFKSRYADLAAVWEAVREPLASNGLSVSQLPSAEGGRVTLTTMLMHSSGQYISQELTMQARDAQPQSVGSCLTYARRYALAAVAGVAQDDDDGNEAQKEAPKEVPKPAAKPKTPDVKKAAPTYEPEQPPPPDDFDIPFGPPVYVDNEESKQALRDAAERLRLPDSDSIRVMAPIHAYMIKSGVRLTDVEAQLRYYTEQQRA